MIRNIVPDIDAHVGSRIKTYPQHRNWASSIGNPCLRYLVYCRLNWQDKQLHDVGLEYIFREGRKHEEDVVQLLKDAGYTVQESQRAFDYEPAQITGRIDGKIIIDGVKIPIEIKSMHQWAWDEASDEASIKNSDSHYIRGYYDAFQVYLLMNNSEEGIIFLKNKQTGRIKQVNITLDYAYAESVIKKCETVNALVQKKEYPERINDKSVCSRCAFNATCLPDEQFDAVNLNLDPELLELIKQREMLAPQAKAFEQINDRLKEDFWPHLDAGTHIVGTFQVKVTRIEKTYYAVPDDIKKPYEQSRTETRAKVTPLDA